MTKVAICVPSQDFVHAAFALDVAKAVGESVRQGVDLALFNVRGSILPQERAALATHALASGADWLWWLDSDMRFPKDALVRLLAHDRPIVGCNYPTRKPPIWPSAQRQGHGRVYTEADSMGLAPVDWMGFGCLLTARTVFERMDKPWFAFGYSRGDDGYVGEDYFWFQKAKALGFDVWLDHDLSQDVFHLAEVPFSQQHAVMARDHEGPDGARLLR